MKTRLALKKLFFAYCLVLSAAIVPAQDISVNSGSNRILDERYPGFKTRITGDSDHVEKYLKSAFRDLGKLRDRGTYFHITDVTLAGEYYEDRSFFAELNRGPEQQGVWIGVDTTGLSELGWHLISEDIETYTYSLTTGYYRQLAQEDIDETEKAADYIRRRQRRLARDTSSLRSDLHANEEELVRLLEAIEDNKAEHEQLLLSIKNTKLELDSVNRDLIRIEAIIERKKQKRDSIR